MLGDKLTRVVKSKQSAQGIFHKALSKFEKAIDEAYSFIHDAEEDMERNYAEIREKEALRTSLKEEISSMQKSSEKIKQFING